CARGDVYSDYYAMEYW
nr:immunoglobulin heavy chain junction region [Mus musculus]